MSGVLRWTGGLIVIALLLASGATIVSEVFDADWGSAVTGLVGLILLVGATVTIRNARQLDEE